jgi:muramoyltetrapeptide carboxypeptidase
VVSEYDYPVCFNFPAGHQDLNKAIYFGMDAVLEVNALDVKLYYPHITT